MAIWVLMAMAQLAWAAPSLWDAPAAMLAGKVADIMGPGQARLTVDNLSTIGASEVPAIRAALERELKSHGITASGAESANQLHVTLSENAHERLWVAEVVQGNETRVAMVSVWRPAETEAGAAHQITLMREEVLTAAEPVVGLMKTELAGLVAIEPDRIAPVMKNANGSSTEMGGTALGGQLAVARDAHGVTLAGSNGYETWLPGIYCAWRDLPADVPMVNAKCRASDDPWPIAGTGNVLGTIQLKAFYNARRNYFTGVVTPSLGVDLPPFYSAVMIPRAVGGAALLIGGTDGKVQLVENNALRPVSGTRDWGSDFAVLNSAWGLGTQVIASGSGDGANDSVRAYELPGLEAVPVSAPLAMGGPVVALWPAPDGRSVYVTVKLGAERYEVDRVTALFN